MIVNSTKTILPSATRTASVDSEMQTNMHTKGGHILINVTAAVGAPSVVFTIQGYDATSETYYDMLVSAAVVATGITFLSVYPGLWNTSSKIANMNIPKHWRVRAVAANADALTYSVSANMLV